MRIKLAGCNIDRETLSEWMALLEKMVQTMNRESFHDAPEEIIGELKQRARSLLLADNLTPETISAAYARISRDPRPVDQIRDEARHWVSKARRSNRRIVFGMGHASIAEHAVFNIDIIGVSRYLAEYIQHHRLCSFTEKSQRYIRLGKDYMVPDEVREHGMEPRYRQFVETMFHRYRQIWRILADEGRVPEEKAGEDARYVLPLGVTTQMGMTANARAVEYILQCAASSPLAEFRKFGEVLLNTVKTTAPSLIRHVKAVPGLLRTERPVTEKEPESPPEKPVVLADYTPDADRVVRRAMEMRLGGIATEGGKTIPGKAGDVTFFKELFRYMSPWDAAPRELEYVYFRFDIVISAAAFAQLKRHRMATITAGPYNPSLGVTIPPSFIGTSAEELMRKSAGEAEMLYRDLMTRHPQAASYPLLSGHRRRILMQLNARELIHLARLRDDEHAQWDIRNLTGEMLRLAREKAPLCLMLACGKDKFREQYRFVYGEYPPETFPTGAT